MRHGQIGIYLAAVVTAVVSTPFILAQGDGGNGLLASSWRSFTTGDFPNFAPIAGAFADLDGDRDIDVLVAHEFFSGPGLVVMLNNGDGTFAATSRYDLPYMESIADVALADIDRDGRLDAIATIPDANSQSSKGYWWPGNGNGTFSPARRTFSTGPGPLGVAVGDFTGDGFPDIVTADGAFFGNGSTISLMRHNGQSGSQAGFLPPVSTTIGANVQRVEAADLDGDGDLDLLVGRANASGNAVLHNNGSGGFAAPVFYQHAPGTQNPGAAVALVDVDRDGRSDLMASATTANNGVVSIRRNNGDGTFASPVVYNLMAYSWTLSSIASADLNGDGWPDVIGTTPSGRAVDGFHVLLSNGSGGFQTGMYYPAAKQTVEAMAFDADGDGDADVLTLANDSAVLTLHINAGDGRLPVLPQYAIGTLTHNMDGADIDGDSDLDLVSVDSAARILRNNGDGTFTSAVQFSTPINPGSVLLRDMNNDGFPDMVLGPDANFPPYNFAVALNRGDGTFNPGVVTQVGASQAGVIDTSDLNHDGRVDVILTDPGPAAGIYIYSGNGNGTSYSFVRKLPASGPNGIRAIDLDHDTHPDLLSNTALGLTTWPGRGDFTFDPIITQGEYAADFDLADFNGDGHLDLCTLIPQDSFGTVQVSIMLGYGDGDFGFPNIYPGPSGRESAFRISSNCDAADVDGDGLMDLVLTSNAPGDVAIFRGNGDGTLRPMDRYGAGYSAHSSVIGDFTGDGVSDVACIMSLPPGGFADVVVMMPGLGSARVFSLSVSGACPGVVTLTARNATPRATVAFVYAFGRGSVIIPSGPCAGTRLGLNATATLLRTVRADAGGTATTSGSAPPSACGRVFVQALDTSNCSTSNVEGI